MGFDIGDFEIGGALLFSFANTEVNEVPVNGSPGRYKSNSVVFALSGTWRR